MRRRVPGRGTARRVRRRTAGLVERRKTRQQHTPATPKTMTASAIRTSVKSARTASSRSAELVTDGTSTSMRLRKSRELILQVWKLSNTKVEFLWHSDSIKQSELSMRALRDTLTTASLIRHSGYMIVKPNLLFGCIRPRKVDPVSLPCRSLKMLKGGSPMTWDVVMLRISASTNAKKSPQSGSSCVKRVAVK